MPPAPARSRSAATIRSDRRLGIGIGIALSLLLHGLLLSLQLGVPGLDPGSGGPIAVTLAPPVARSTTTATTTTTTTTPAVERPPESAPEPLPPSVSPAPVAAPTSPPLPQQVRGLRLVDRPPAPPPPEIVKPANPQAGPRPAPPVRIKPRLRRIAPPVIVAAPNPVSEFTLPLPEVAPGPELAQQAAPDAALSTLETTAESADQEAEASARLAVEHQRLREIEQAQDQERIAQQQHAADDARKAAELEAQQLVRQRDEQRLVDEQALLVRQDEARQAQDAAAAAAARANAELMRQREADDLAARQLAEQRQTEQRQAEQAALQAQADAQLREQRREQQREQQREQEQSERQRIEAQRMAQEQAQRQRLELLNQRRLAQERASAEQLAQQQARQQADEAARSAAAERLQAQGPGLAPGSVQPGAAGVGAGAGDVGPGSGSAAGERSRPDSFAGIPGSRARELLRGLTIPGAMAPAPARDRGDPRRVVADGGERDAPLRLYVDSVRQKLERNAVLGGARLTLRDVRIDPLVSLALRSDGSVDDVTIVRSSGRADVDDAVRRFVQLNARYSAFPPNVAARFDVIEIRRIWRFTDSLKLVEEMR